MGLQPPPATGHTGRALEEGSQAPHSALRLKTEATHNIYTNAHKTIMYNSQKVETRVHQVMDELDKMWSYNGVLAIKGNELLIYAKICMNLGNIMLS